MGKKKRSEAAHFVAAPAVPTIRSYRKTAHQNRGNTPSVMLCATIQLADDDLSVHHWFTLLSLICKIIIHSNALKIKPYFPRKAFLIIILIQALRNYAEIINTFYLLKYASNQYF